MYIKVYSITREYYCASGRTGSFGTLTARSFPPRTPKTLYRFDVYYYPNPFASSIRFVYIPRIILLYRLHARANMRRPRDVFVLSLL